MKIRRRLRAAHRCARGSRRIAYLAAASAVAKIGEGENRHR
jgi:hypothetical protein